MTSTLSTLSSSASNLCALRSLIGGFHRQPSFQCLFGHLLRLASFQPLLVTRLAEAAVFALHGEKFPRLHTVGIDISGALVLRVACSVHVPPSLNLGFICWLRDHTYQMG